MAVLRTCSAITAALSPVAQWRFDEAGGPTLVDSAAGLNGVYQGDVTFGQSGAVGADGAVRFAGDDLIEGRPGPHGLIGGDGNVTLHGSNGPDSLRGEGGDDRIFGGKAVDTIDGGPGADLIGISGASLNQLVADNNLELT